MAQALLNPQKIDQTWTAPYFRLVRFSDEMIPDSTTGALAADTAWADTGFDLTLNTDTGVYPFDLPVAVVPECVSGRWLVEIYEKAGADYASTDTFLTSFEAANGMLITTAFDYPTSTRIWK